MAFGASITNAGSLYLGRRENVPWQTAKERCECFGGHLATWSNSNDVNAIKSVVAQLGSPSFVGIDDISKEGHWEMIDGDTDYCAPDALNPKPDCDDIDEWNNGQPNDYATGSGEDCAEMNSNGKLNDITCTDYRKYVCEFDTDNYGFAKSGSKIYVGRKEQADWNTAKGQCECWGGQLATFSNNAEFELMKKVVTPSFGDRAWIGLKADSPNEFAFIDGDTSLCNAHTCAKREVLPYWGPNEPNNPGSENCVELLRTGELNNMPCDRSQSMYYVCEFDADNYGFDIGDLEVPMPRIPEGSGPQPVDFGPYSAQDLMVVALAVFAVINVVTLAVFCLRAKGTATARYYSKVVVDSDEDARLNA